MKTIVLILCVLFCFSSYGEESPEYIEYQKQVNKFWAQMAEADKQLEISNRQANKLDELIQRQEAQLDRWDSILNRYERVLNAMEKQHDIKQ